LSALSTNQTQYLTSLSLSWAYENHRTCMGRVVRGRHRSAGSSEQCLSWWRLITTVSSDLVPLSQAPNGEWSDSGSGDFVVAGQRKYDRKSYVTMEDRSLGSLSPSWQPCLKISGYAFPLHFEKGTGLS